MALTMASRPALQLLSIRLVFPLVFRLRCQLARVSWRQAALAALPTMSARGNTSRHCTPLAPAYLADLLTRVGRDTANRVPEYSRASSSRSHSMHDTASY